MMMNEVSVLLDVPMQLGECPLWHPDEAALYWVDIEGFAIHCYVPSTGTHRSWETPSEPACIARCLDSGLFVAMRSGLALLDTRSGELTPIADAPYDRSKARFNDGRCDSAGRFWAGTLYEPRDQPAGSLFCIERGILRDMNMPVTVSNGLAFSLDSRTLYHADTSAHRIMAYDFDAPTAQTSNGRVFKQFSMDKTHNDYGGRPDGAAIDSEGAYWCAMYEGGRLLRLSSSGDILREILLPVRCPTMLAFGGADLRTLFITTVRHNRSATELSQHPLSGYVLTMHVDVPGCAEPAYIP